MRVISPLSININQVSHILQVTCILQISCVLKCKFLEKLNPQTSISTNILIIFILLLFVCLIILLSSQCKDIKKMGKLQINFALFCIKWLLLYLCGGF